jgi:hypothetical protein
MASSDITALITSRRPAFGSRYSGSVRGPRRSRRPITGTPIRNTEPHQKASRKIPPRTGPTAPPAEYAAIQNPIAVVRCFWSRNIVKMSDSVEGATVAPKTPMSARLAMSISELVENAASSDDSANPTAPPSRSRRRPTRSPRVPIVMSRPATRNP